MIASSDDKTPPVLFCLHFLGGSAGSWRWLQAALAGSVRVVPIDLPGFGDAASLGARDVAGMRDHVAAAIRAEGAPRWRLAGHSMGAKVALAVARLAEDGGLPGLEGLVLMAGSPPAPEPMDESRREDMIGWFADGPPPREQAVRYIQANSASPLPEDRHAAAVEHVLATHPEGWRGWLAAGSREDWRARIGVLETPALVLSGAEDADLGPEAQQRLMAPHLRHARLATLPGLAHLLPQEAPERVARLILEHWTAEEMPAAPEADFGALLRSARCSAATRAVLTARAEPVAAPLVLDAVQRDVLRAAAARIVPQGTSRDGEHLDLAARVEAQLAEGGGDGWRFAALPPDLDAYRAGLDALEAAAQARDGAAFAALPGERQDALLETPPAGRLDAAAMALWVADLRADLVRLYMAHPATLARIGFSGPFYGGDTPRLPGFTALGIGEREAWEPQAVAS